MATHKDLPLAPPNRSALWSSLQITKTQLAELCGLTTRQVSHWTSQGYLMAAGRNPDRYNGDAIDLCVLVKQGLMSGVPLKRSVAMAREYITHELRQQPSLAVIVPPTLLDIREKLRGAEASIGTVLQVIEPLVPRTPGDELLVKTGADGATEMLHRV